MTIRYAVPLLDGVLAEHFGHCEQFAFVDTDPAAKAIISIERRVPPAHEPGVLPRWLLENKTNVAIVGGMGMRARQMLEEAGVRVIMGAEPLAPEKLVKKDLEGTLTAGDNTCSHGPDHVCDGDHDQHHKGSHGK
jgi:predicted Fe-Mo cluster-binding NifX family protein